jgi:hypothetical protein
MEHLKLLAVLLKPWREPLTGKAARRPQFAARVPSGKVHS